MDVGFEGGFVALKNSVPGEFISNNINSNTVGLKNTRFHTIFANDILECAQRAWVHHFAKRGVDAQTFHRQSIVDLVKQQAQGQKVFPENVDVVTGGFPCQDFSIAGKRKGFDSHKNHRGQYITEDEPTEETRGKLYMWMKAVVDICKPKIFIAENVRGLVNLSNVKDIIQKDFSRADDDGYIVLSPRVLHSADYGVAQSRQRVIFIGIRKSALKPEFREMFASGVIPCEFDPYPKPTHAFTIDSTDLLPPVSLDQVFRSLEEPHLSADLSQQYFSRAKFMGEHCQGQKEINLQGIGPTIRAEHHGNIEFRRLSVEHGGRYVDELAAGYPERRLTPRECALIQSFPPDYEFVIAADKKRFLVSPSEAYKIIGNAVPPLLAYNIARRLEELWDTIF